MKKLKAEILRHGAEVETIYGSDVGRLIIRAMKRLYTPVPSCTPKMVIVFYQIPYSHRGRPLWQEVERIHAEKRKANK